MKSLLECSAIFHLSKCNLQNEIIIWQRPNKEPAMVQQALENFINPFGENPRRREEWWWWWWW